MKTLHIIDKIGLGGPQTIVKEIIEKQSESNQMILYVLRETDIIIAINHSNVLIYPSHSKLSFKPLKELKRIALQEKIDILHCHGYRSQVFGWILKKYFLHRVKLIFHEHGDIFRNNKIYNLLLRLSISQVDLFLAVSNTTRQQLMRKAHIQQNKLRVIHNFVDLHKYNRKNNVLDNEEEKRKMNFNKDDFIIGFAGRLIKIKGWEYFIGAAELASVNFINAKFVVAGDGNDKEKMLKKIERKHLNNNVKYLGYISEMAQFYSLLNCLVLPSYRETMPLTIIEAQAMGVPVVASNIDTLKELIVDGESGLFFEPKNEEDLFKKVMLLLTNDYLRQRIIEGGLKAAKRYSLKVYIEKLNIIYGELT